MGNTWKPFPICRAIFFQYRLIPGIKRGGRVTRSIKLSVFLGSTSEHLLHDWSWVGCLPKRALRDLGDRLKVWGLSIFFRFASLEMICKMCWSTSQCQPSGVRWEQARGKKKNKHESFLGLFGVNLYLSESPEQQSKPGPLASALRLCVQQYEFCFNYLC